jgi:uncharacterized protein (TIRG00374 family)
LNNRFFRLLINIIKYVLTLGIAAALLWYVYKDIDFEEAILKRMADINLFWVALSIFFGLLSHMLRAYRWNILLEPLGYQLKTLRTFLAVMVGYFANIFVPRMGEITRCGILKKTDDVALTSALGSVVAERAFDMLVLVSLTVFGFLVEFDKLASFVKNNIDGNQQTYEKLKGIGLIVLVVGLVLLVIGLILLRMFKEQIRRNAIVIKIRRILRELVEGFLSIRKIKRKAGFWLSTIGMWVLYFLMAYVVFFAVPETSNLGVLAGLSVLIMGGIGMSAPVQGGFGTYHIFVSSILALYGVAEEDGKFFAFILHTFQFVTFLIVGAISLVISLLISKSKTNGNTEQDTESGSTAVSDI